MRKTKQVVSVSALAIFTGFMAFSGIKQQPSLFESIANSLVWSVLAYNFIVNC